MPLSKSVRPVEKAASFTLHVPDLEFPVEYGGYRPDLSPNVGATQDIASLMTGSRSTPSLLVTIDDNTPSSIKYRPLQNAGKQKARARFAEDKQSAAQIFVLEQLGGLPLGNSGWRRADSAFPDPMPEGNGSPLGNALLQGLDAAEHFTRSSAKVGNPTRTVVFAPCLDWLTCAEPTTVLRTAAERARALAEKFGKRFHVQPIAVGEEADLAAAEMFAFQHKVLRLEEVSYDAFYLWLVEVSMRASAPGDDFRMPSVPFLKPLG